MMIRFGTILAILLAVTGAVEEVKQRPHALHRVQSDIENNTAEIDALKGKYETLLLELETMVTVELLATSIESSKLELNTKIQEITEKINSYVSCPTSAGYVSNSVPKLCYKRYAMDVSHADAVKTCEGDNALLISLDTNEKLNHIINYLNSLGASAYNQGLNRYQLWIGLLRENGGEYKWANGETIVPRWAPGEPSAPTSRDCGQLLKGGIGDITCTPDFTGKQPFICEISQED